LEYQVELENSIKGIFQRSSKAYEAKLIPEIEFLEVEAIHNQVHFQRESANSGLKSAYLILYQNMGIGLDEQAAVDLDLEFQPVTVEMEPFLRMVLANNLDIKIKEAAAETAYFGVKVFDAKKQPRVDVRGSVGLQGEVKTGGDNATTGPFGTGPDLENEQYIAVNVSMPFGPHSSNYAYQRRFFGPTISAFQGSEDYKHTWGFNLFDKLAEMTDEDLAKADYLNALAELNHEKTTQTVSARDAYFEYNKSLLQLETSQFKIKHRTHQVALLEHTTKTEDSRITELMNEMVTLAEDKFSKVSSISSAKIALTDMNRLVGIEGYYTDES
jgi:outer membrane protein TolC